jgi:hypothetical protein
MLTNLKQIYFNAKEFDSALTITDYQVRTHGTRHRPHDTLAAPPVAATAPTVGRFSASSVVGE